MEVKQHMINLETRHDGLNLRTSNFYSKYMPNMNECLNRNKQTNYLITFERHKWNTINVATGIFDFHFTKIKQQVN